MKLLKYTIRVTLRGEKYVISVDEDPTLPEQLGADQEYSDPNSALGHFMFQLSTLDRLENGVRLDLRLEQ